MKRTFMLRSCFVVILILTFTSGNLTTNEEELNERPLSKHSLSVLTPHERIVIENDTALAAWPGAGTEGNPYRIEGFNITSANSSIRIENTTKHFVIENCFISSLFDEFPAGIEIENVSNGNIVNCTVTSEWNAIEIMQARNFTVTNCTIFDVQVGIQFYLLNDTIISHNTLFDITTAISGWTCSGLIISANDISNWSHEGITISGDNTHVEVTENIIRDSNEDPYFMYGGITLFYTSGVLVDRNMIYSCSVGIYSDFYTYDCQITNNEIENCSIAIHICYGYNLSIESNRILDTFTAFYISDSQYISLIDNDVESEVYHGIYLRDSLHCIIEANSMKNAGILIDARSPSHWNHTIVNNFMGDRKLGYFAGVSDQIIDAEDYAQIILVFSQNVTITNGVFSNASSGVVMAFCDGCEIRNSLVVDNFYFGIDLRFTTLCIVADCNITENGRYPYGGGGGIRFEWAVSSIITRNRIYLNDGLGIGGYSAGSNNFIYNNVITNNTEHGILFWFGSYDNVVYGNVIGWNILSNALDSGTNNTWDNGLDLGNQWSDYNGTGVYEISGSADAVDRFPQKCGSWDLVLPMSVDEELDYLVIVVAIGAGGIILIVVVLIMKKGTEVQTQSTVVAGEGLE